MSRLSYELEQRCLGRLRRHLEAGDELSLSEAYEFGREALAEGLGVMDVAVMLWRVSRQALDAGDAPGEVLERRVEDFLLECLSPFEMAYRGSREANQTLRELDERREEQARRIARELHDQAGQLLVTVYLALERVRPHLSGAGEEPFGQAVELLHQVEDQLRGIAHELRPSILDDLGFMPALRFLGEGVAKRSGLAVTVKGSTGGRLPPKIEVALYRVAQEALSNVARHARASHVVLEVERGETDVGFHVRDDGRGFDPRVVPAAAAGGGFGLDGIRERLAPFGGALEVSSQPGHGTALLIRIPLEVSHARSIAHR